MDNYTFCANWVEKEDKPEKFKVLDYGCGAGKIVKKLLERGMDAYGCDIFYAGGDYSHLVDKKLFENKTIRRIENNRIPFEDNTFDIITNNQVMEHVEDIESVMSEINRVLKPGGKVLSLFPDKSIWREGHCGIAFLHWFSSKSKIRPYWAAFWRAVGFGYHKEDKSIMAWSQHFCNYLDNWTHYRSKKVIDENYMRYFYKIDHIEDFWLRQRLEKKAWVLNYIPKFIQKLIVRKLGGLVFVANKQA